MNSSDIKKFNGDMLTSNRDTLNNGTRTSEAFVLPNNIEFPDLRNVSTSTTTSFNPNASLDSSHQGTMTSETIQISPDSPRASIPTNTTQTSNMLIDEETGIVLNSLFNVIHTDFTNIFKLVNNLHNIIIDSVSPDDALVQIYPRFIRNSFEGIVWTKSDPSFASKSEDSSDISNKSDQGMRAPHFFQSLFRVLCFQEGSTVVQVLELSTPI